LQNKHGLNVTLILWCLWTGAHFDEPGAATLKRAAAIGDEWERKVVAPLRDVRRALKAGVGGATNEALRAQVKAAELAAEFEAMNLLDLLTRAQAGPIVGTNSAAHARRTLAAYVRASGAAETPGFSVGLLEELIGLTVSAPNQGAIPNARDD
jgi:uncharacterized protein (TIGR02444 family)